MKIRNMRKQILLFVAVAFTLSSCGIYSKYKPVSEVPDGLYGSTDESAAQTADTANFGNLAWREVFSDPFLQTLIDSVDLTAQRLPRLIRCLLLLHGRSISSDV